MERLSLFIMVAAYLITHAIALENCPISPTPLAVDKIQEQPAMKQALAEIHNMFASVMKQHSDILPGLVAAIVYDQQVDSTQHRIRTMAMTVCDGALCLSVGS